MWCIIAYGMRGRPALAEEVTAAMVEREAGGYEQWWDELRAEAAEILVRIAKIHLKITYQLYIMKYHSLAWMEQGWESTLYPTRPVPVSRNDLLSPKTCQVKPGPKWVGSFGSVSQTVLKLPTELRKGSDIRRISRTNIRRMARRCNRSELLSPCGWVQCHTKPTPILILIVQQL